MSRELKIVLVVVVVVFVVLPAVVVGAFLLLGAISGFLFYEANQSTVYRSRREELLRDVAMLQASVEEKQATGQAVTSCGSEAEATASLEKDPTHKHVLDASVPAEKCLLDLGADDYPTYGWYWVEIRGDGGYVVGGVQDADGDGEVAKATVSNGGFVQLVTGDGVF